MIRIGQDTSSVVRVWNFIRRVSPPEMLLTGAIAQPLDFFVRPSFYSFEYLKDQARLLDV